MSVEAKIKAYISEKGIKQTTLSKKAGITTPKLNLSLNEKRRMTFPEYMSICEALEVPKDKFLAEETINVAAQCAQ